MVPSSASPLLLLLLLGVARAQLDLLLSPTDGSYSVSLGGRPWLHSGSPPLYRVGVLDSETATLVKVGGSNSSGHDALGAYNSTTFSWAADADKSDVLMETTFKTYKTDGGAIVFEQHFPRAVTRSELRLPQHLATAGINLSLIHI